MRRHTSIALYVALVGLILLRPTVLARGRVGPRSHAHTGMVLNVKPSGLAHEIHSLMLGRKQASVASIIAVGNSRISQAGVDYEFEVSRLIEHSQLKPISGNESDGAIHRLPMRTVGGEALLLEVEVSPEGPCGERTAQIPIAGLNKSAIDVVSEGKHYRLQRPPSFSLEWMSLVDRTMKKRLRTWELPFVAQPSGVSPDGRTIYLDSNGGFGQPSELTLAISDGVYSFADARDLLAREKPELIEDFPRDPNDAYAGYKRFLLGSEVFIIRFEWPCT
jgi:hypothetical protein